MKNLLKDLGIKIVILSRGRYNNLKTVSLVPDYIPVVVPESEKELYSKACKNPLITTPDDIKGLGRLRNWCLDNFEEETIIMVDDDISRCYSLTSKQSRPVKDPEEIVQVLVNAAIMAKDMGTNVFGFSQRDIRTYRGYDPFHFNTWVGGIIGVIGKEQKFRNDYFKVDIDFCLQSLMDKRIVFCDSRYYFLQNRDNNVGGNSLYRTKELYQKSADSLKAKWKGNVRVKWHKSQMNISLNVPRRQSLTL